MKNVFFNHIIQFDYTKVFVIIYIYIFRMGNDIFNGLGWEERERGWRDGSLISTRF